MLDGLRLWHLGISLTKSNQNIRFWICKDLIILMPFHRAHNDDEDHIKIKMNNDDVMPVFVGLINNFN